MIKIDDTKHQVFLGDKEVKVTPKEFDILKFFVRDSKGAAVSKESLLKMFWPDGADIVTLNVNIYRLRKKLGKFKDRLVTIHSLGLRYDA